MNKLALIDADFILYKVCCPKKQTETELMFYPNQQDRTFEQICKELDDYLVNKIFIPTTADYYIGFLGGTGNYRFQVDSGYKSGRPTEKPKYFYEAKQYLVDKWKFVIVNGMEAEDAVGITLDTYVNSDCPAEGISDYIIVGQDHDLQQLPGTHYNPVKNEWLNISVQEANYNFWKQMLTGCSTDKVQGIPKIGEKTACKIYDSWINVDRLREIALYEYIKHFGEYKGIEEFAKNYKLLKILREKEDFVIPEIQQINCVPKQEVNIDNIEF